MALDVARRCPGLVALIALGGLAWPVRPALGEVKWIPLVPGAAPGTQAKVAIDPVKSTAQRTVVDVQLFGYYSEQVKGPDGKQYHRLEVPGLPPLGQVGAPSLPAVRFRLGVATGAAAAVLTSVDVLASKTASGVMPWPQPVEGAADAIDPKESPGPGDSDGEPEEFAFDPAVYSSKKPWPPTPGAAAPKARAMFGNAKGCECEVTPVTWNPDTKVLLALTHVRYTYDHPGTATALGPCTKEKKKLLDAVFLNSSELSSYWPQNLIAYAGRYLIVTNAEFAAAVQPLVEQRKQTGFAVTVKTVAAGASATTVRYAIADWYAAGSPEADHYCLLVGDTTVIPQRLKPGLGYDQADIWSDDEYGSPFDLDLDEEVYVGRLSADDVADLQQQIAKIVAYEDHPLATGKYGRALLVAHEGNPAAPPGGFQSSLEIVEHASYAVQPQFLTAYGSEGATNLDVASAIGGGVGLVCYEGHGSTNAWSGWNTAGESFHKNDVLALSNSLLPVVWSICCSNQNLAFDAGTSNDCIGENWLELNGAGAVAHYASTHLSWVKQNHKLSQHLFDALYDRNLTRHGHAIAWAEARAKEDWPNQNNPWMYLLLGDPAMHVRRESPLSISPKYPQQVEPCLGANCLDLVFEVKLPPGPPVEGALVSLWKPALAGDVEDEVLVNGYTDAAGVVHLAAAPKTTGPLYFTIRDDGGILATGEIAVAPCATAASNQPYGAGKAGSAGVPTLTPIGLPRVGETSGIQVGKAKPGAMATLIVGVAPAALAFDGGTLLVQPAALLPVPAPIGAFGSLSIQGPIPADAGLCGLSLYHQVFVSDPGAAGPYHQAMTNGLLRVLGS